MNASVTAPAVYVLGAAGQLGSALIRSSGALAESGWSAISVVPVTSAEVDVRSSDSVRRGLARLNRGDVVINAAAHTDVDGAESAADDAYAINADGPGHLAALTGEVGAHLIHVSTDYVFPKSAASLPAAEYRPLEPSDLPADARPDTVYGASKLAGERAVRSADPHAVIVRTAWVFTGRAPVRDFVTTMRRLESERATVSVVDDQHGSPTYAPDLAAGLWELVGDLLVDDSRASGRVLHATNAGAATWCDVARTLFELVGADPQRVTPCTTEQFPRPAPRPAYSVLSGESWARVGLTPLRNWRAALAEAVADGASG
ncbi:dTDP-4-dehydrorhamnose reductase [Gordonia zhaorongruii]|uniref:dTDP-4-dehydrorhamnose reductase n=1 Tax=Gordonia zhaorongruii TaxID=2597659 RepID=UPI002E26CAB8